MKILRVIGSMDPVTGGPCQGVRNSVPVWDAAGHETLVVCLDDPKADFLKTETLNILALGPSRTSWGYAPALEKWLKENLNAFDAVVAHGLWQYHTFTACRTADHYRKKHKTSHPKIYIIPHGMLDPYFQNASDRKLKALRNLIYWKLIESKTVKLADALLFTTGRELELARTTFSPYRPVKEVNIGYGVPSAPVQTDDMIRAFRDQCAGLDNKPFILYMSRIHPKKGTDLLLNAYAALFRDTGLRNSLPALVVAGPGMETSFGAELERFVNEHLRQAPVFFPGMLQGDAKWGALYACDAFILPSHQENFGISVAEALSCGKPVLISDQVNISDEIKQGGAGFVAPDTEEGATALLRAWMNLSDEKKTGMSGKAMETYKQQFETVTATRKMISFIEQNHA